MQPLNQVRAALLLRNLTGASAAAVAAGHQPAPEWRAADGLSRGEAQAIHQWALSLPGIALAYSNRGHPAQREVRALYDLVSYFATAHPQRGDGSPASWAELGELALSPAMTRYLTGTADVPIGELHPAEAAEFGAYLGDLHGVTAAQPEIAAAQAGLRQRAAEPVPDAEPGMTPPGAESRAGNEGGTAMTENDAQARVTELHRGLLSRTASPIDKGARVPSWCSKSQPFQSSEQCRQSGFKA